MVFDFSFVNVVCGIDLRMLNHPCEPGMNPTWLWCIIFFMCCWIQLAKIFLRWISFNIYFNILACTFRLTYQFLNINYFQLDEDLAHFLSPTLTLSAIMILFNNS